MNLESLFEQVGQAVKTFCFKTFEKWIGKWIGKWQRNFTISLVAFVEWVSNFCKVVNVIYLGVRRKIKQSSFDRLMPKMYFYTYISFIVFNKQTL